MRDIFILTKGGISPDPETFRLFFMFCTFCYSHVTKKPFVQPCLFTPLAVALLKQNIWQCHRNATKHLYSVLGYVGLVC